MYLAVCASGAADMVGVAQLVERRVVVADVAGSSPVTHPIEAARAVCPGRFALSRPPLPRRTGVQVLGGAVPAAVAGPSTLTDVAVTPAAEIEVDEPLVRGLLQEQHPEL